MVALKPGQSSTKDGRPRPAGLFGHQPSGATDDGGFFVDLTSLTFRVLDADGVEAVPLTAVDVDRDSPTTDALLDVRQGLYAPTITVPATVSYGTWTIEWTYVVEPGDDPAVTHTEFTVIDPAHPVVNGYVQVQDVYDEGVPTALFSPTRVQRAVSNASRLFELYTGRYFDPRLVTSDVDGRGGPLIQLGNPIVGLTDVRFTFTTFRPADQPIELGNLRVYNRHIRNNLLRPDDRDDPRVEFLRVESVRFPRGAVLGNNDLLSAAIGFQLSQQNIKVEGVFGYTDPDGTPFGKTPELVREAVTRIALTKLQPLWSATGGGGFMGVSGPLQREQTMDQMAHWADATASGSGAYVGHFTGDPTVDQIISAYRRPPALGSTGP